MKITYDEADIVRAVRESVERHFPEATIEHMRDSYKSFDITVRLPGEVVDLEVDEEKPAAAVVVVEAVPA